MKWLLLFTLLYCAPCRAQKHSPMPHGMVFGQKPDTSSMVKASNLQVFMGKKTRISTTVSGTIIRVTKTQGGWFELDAGAGKIIAAHFANFNIMLPAQLKGRDVIIDGVAQKQFIADDLQHFAGDTVKGKKQHQDKTNPLRSITFEVKGLMVDR